MSKAFVVIDKPEKCLECPFLNGNDECILQDEDSNFTADTWDKLKSSCPLRELPEKDTDNPFPDEYESGYRQGWNNCIGVITGDEE